MNRIVCIYHGNCPDGFAAAWVVRRALGKGVVFVAGHYDDPPPDVTGDYVYVVDFSYKLPATLKLCEMARHVVLLDHHKSAKEELCCMDAPSNLYAKFDMDRSGAILAWEYFFLGDAPPTLLRHVQDRDLWRFELPDTKEVIATLLSHPYDFDLWDRLVDAPTGELAAEGRALLRKHSRDVGELLSVTRRTLVIDGYEVPAANLPHIYASDAGHAMDAGVPFAACYYDSATHRHFSLRSRPEGVDVSVVARSYGGGGHARAAGFRVPLSDAWKFEPDSIEKE